MTTALAPATSSTTALSRMSVHDIIEAAGLIQDVMAQVMKKDHHYGVIPGCGDKPTLLKPGAEKLALTFRLAPSFTMRQTDLGNGHREVEVVCTLTHIPTGEVFGQGVGCCSTMESKYRWRGGARLCPECNKPCIKKSKYPPRNAPRDAEPGYYCFGKIGGCGKEFAHDDKRITGQSEERQENPDIADQYNTVLKMAKKRAQIDATLTATGASDIFAQDLEDLAGKGAFDVANGVADAPPAATPRDPKADDIPFDDGHNPIPEVPVTAYAVKASVAEMMKTDRATGVETLKAARDAAGVKASNAKDFTDADWLSINTKLPAPWRVQ